ncbi:MAG: hypothetical protein ACI9TI_002312 [Natronomonas sp.]|jgi:hypothetical protein|uniref:hypothetical protein n=1 Tax=Natronomonas sp. TaxID=2184060 RepID=UPI003988D669
MSHRQLDPDWTTWNDAIDDVLSEELSRDDDISVTAEGLEIDVPLAFGAEAPRATWRFDGDLTVRVEGDADPLADWLRFWARRSGAGR